MGHIAREQKKRPVNGSKPTKPEDFFNLEEVYSVCVGILKILPSEFWQMTPSEVMSIVEINRPKDINGIPEDEFYQMIERREELEAQGIKVL